MLLTRVLLQYKRDCHKTKRDLNMFTKIRCMQKPVYWLRVFVITQSNNAYCDFEMYYTGVLYIILLSLKNNTVNTRRLHQIFMMYLITLFQ